MNLASLALRSLVLGTAIFAGCASPASEEEGSSSAAATGADQVAASCAGRYGSAASACNEKPTDSEFDACVAGAKADLKTCCKASSSPTCANDAQDKAEVAAIDGACQGEYSRAAKACEGVSDDAAFATCSANAKSKLKTCCKQSTSADCAADAE